MEPVKAARWFIKHDFAIFPVWPIEDAGRCACGNAACRNPGKHPIGDLAPQGLHNAASDPQTIEQWWGGWPDANIGIATGDASGIIVLDIDVGHGGADTLDNLIDRHGELPDTWSVRTGGGGFHAYFRMPAADIRNSAGAIGPGIDVRGNGGYVVAPPSLHVSGNRYRWDEECHPSKATIASIPDWLMRKMLPSSTLGSSADVLPRVIKEGMRNSWMTSAAGTMRRRGFSEAAILAALHVENRDRCKPPLSERELSRIARSIDRYRPAPVVTVGGQMVAHA